MSTCEVLDYLYNPPEDGLVLRIVIGEITCNSAEKIFRVATRDITTGEAIRRP